MPMSKNTILGSHTAMKGESVPLTEKVVDSVENKIYIELSANPIPKLSPIPPRTFRDESETPIKVMIKAANGMA
jgi:hypothetical protein